jgi:hypothetical protein
MEIKMTNNKLSTHPFAQIATADIAQVSGGNLIQVPDFKVVTMKHPEDGISYVFDEDGHVTTMAIGEEGGHDLPPAM